MAPGVWDFLASAYPLGHVCVSVCLEAEQRKGFLVFIPFRKELTLHQGWSLKPPRSRFEVSEIFLLSFHIYNSQLLHGTEWMVLVNTSWITVPASHLLIVWWIPFVLLHYDTMNKHHHLCLTTYRVTKEDSEIDKADLEDKLWRLLYFSDPGKLLVWKSHAITIRVPLHIINHAWREVIRKEWNEDYIQINPSASYIKKTTGERSRRDYIPLHRLSRNDSFQLPPFQSCR